MRQILKTTLLLAVFTFYPLIVFGQTTYFSATSGRWNDGATWIGGMVPGVNDYAVISTGTTVSLISSNATIQNLTVNTGAILNAENRIMTVSGSMFINGTFTSKNAAAKDLEFNGDTIGGTGSIIIDFADRSLNINSNTEIIPGSNLKVYGNITLNSGVNIVNKGEIEITGNLIGINNSSSIWINDINSNLKSGGSLLSSGVLDATANGNTVEYRLTGNQDIKTPLSSTYYNITIKGAGNKNILAPLNIEGDLNINNSATLVTNNNSINSGGDWLNYSIFQQGTGVVIFSGLADQLIENPVDQVFWDMTVNKASGDLVLENNVIVENTLSLVSGVIDAQSNRITLGTSTAQLGSLSYFGGYIRGEFERWINNTGTHQFPVGYSNSQRLWITLNGLNSGGSLVSEFVSSDPGNNGLSLDDAGTTIYNTFVEGYWALNEDNGFSLGGANDYNLQLSGSGFTSFAVDNNTRILTRTDAGSNWLAEGTHVAGIGVTARRSGLTTIAAQYALGDDTNCSKPVTSVITGPTDVCSGQTSVAYSVTDNPPNTYTWTVVGGVQVSGGNTNSITVNWDPLGTDEASVSVVEYNACSNGAPVSLDVTIHSVAPEFISGKTSVAENTAGVAYSVAARPGYTYNWLISGGTQTGGGNTNSITVDWGPTGLGNVSVVAELTGCNPAPAVDLDVRLYDVIESVQTGVWNDPNTWDCGCVPLNTENVRIKTGHTVTLHNANDIEINNLIIELGAVLNYNNRPFVVHGDFIVNGTYEGNTARVLSLDGVDTEIDGVGSIEGGFTIASGNKRISSTAVLSVITGDINLGSSVFIENNGVLIIDGDLLGTDVTSTWINNFNSVLEISGSLLAIGELRASYASNTIYYNGAGQTLKNPLASTYYNLILSGSGTKSMSSSLVIEGDIEIGGPCILDATAGNHSINIRGDWINSVGTFLPQNGLVEFDGNVDQTITGNVTFFNLRLSNLTGNLVLADNIIAGNNLDLSGNNIITGSNIITVGTDAANPGSITYNSGYIVGKLERWINSFGNTFYPVGSLASYNPVNFYTNILGSAGTLVGEFVQSDPGSAGLPLTDGTATLSDQFTDGYWDFSSANGLLVTDFNLDLDASNFSSFPVNINTRILKRTNNGDWFLDGTQVDASPPNVYRNNLSGGISGLSTQFGLAYYCAPYSVVGAVSGATCFGEASGEIDITVSGGVAPYSYLWTPGGQTTEDITGLSQGVYGVTVTDALGCITPAIFNVTEPAAVSISDVVTDVTCPGDSDGTIDISVSGGTMPYIYGWTTLDGSGLIFGNEDQSGLTEGTYTVLILDANGCSITEDIVVGMGDVTAPVPLVGVLPDITDECEVTSLVAPVATDNCGGVVTVTNDAVLPINSQGTTVVTWTYDDGNGNISTQPQNVIIDDITAPVLTGCPLDITIPNDAGNCDAVVSWVEPGATDNCTAIGDLVWTKSHIPGDIFPVGTTTVTYTASDEAGNTSIACTFDVTVTDSELPVALCQDIDVYLDVSGNASIVAGDVDGGSTDNCGIATLVAVPNTFTSADLGPNNVTLTVTDINGNSSNCIAVVTVIDNNPPSAVCQDINVYLDAGGNAVITGADIDGGSSDPDGIASLTASPNTFTCSELGVNSVTLTVEDNLGNTATCNANVTVLDTISPSVVTSDINAYLDATGTVTIVPADVDNGSSDACGILSMSLDISSFDCSNSGPNVVNLTVTDNNGNTGVASATVSVLDTISPVANCRDITVAIGASGSASIVAADVDNGSIDNCSIASLTIDQSIFTCADQGVVPVTLTVTDDSGNSSQCVANVTVTSDINAVVNTSSCNSVLGLASYYESTVTGGDGVYSYFWDGLDDAYEPFMEFVLAFPPWILSNTTTEVRPAVSWFLPDGVFDIRLVVTDGNGCVDTTEFQINKTGLTTDNVTARYSDACEGELVSYTVGYEADATYTWDVEEGTIVSAVTDTSEIDIVWNTGVTLGVVNTYITQPGAGGDCESQVVDTVTIHQVPSPSFLAPVVSVCAGSTVSYTLSSTYDSYAWTVSNGSIVSGGSNSDDFVQVLWSNTSPGNVQVDVSTVWGCIASTDVDVDIYDIVGSIDSQVDETCAGAADGEVTVSGSGGLGAHTVSINGGVTFFASPHTFSGLTAGPYTVIVQDALGCSVNVPVNIVVADVTPPTAICQDITVQLDGSGNASITAADIDNGSSDACGIASMTIDVSTFDCTDIGTNNVTLTVTDINSNISTCVSVVTIADTISPVMSDPAPLNVECSTGIPAAYINYAAYAAAGNSASDNCSINQASFTHVSDVSNGSTCPEVITRTYYIEDTNGNSSTCTQIITINDLTNPTASDPSPISVECLADIPLPDINVVSDETDNCAGPITVTHLSDISNGATCPETITRTYRVTDACGNFLDVFQTITINDVTIPTMTAPAPIGVECTSEVPAAYINYTQWTTAGGTASDNCALAPATFTLASETSSGTTCPQTLTRLYQIEDQCGNIGQVTHVITINDVTPPVLTAPPSISIECDIVTEAPVYPGLAAFELAGGTATDNCGIDASSFTHVGDVTDSGSCPETITRTYSLADNCGNATTIDQIIVINDVTNPTASIPSPINVECIGDIPPPDITVVTDESDNCSGPITVSHVGDVSDGGTCPEIITRTYNVADACGNSITVDQLITVNDITPPVLMGVPADVTVECDAIPAPAVVTATDNCPGGLTLNFNQTSIPGSCANSFTLVREWTATDNCGNTTVDLQQITVQDTQAPVVAGSLTDALVEGCTIAAAPAAVNTVAALESLAGGITVTDVCSADGNITVTSSDIVAGTCPIVITRTYTLTDECGNSSTVDHIIRINDTTAPVLTLTPGNVTVECDAIPAVPAIVAIDNCDGIVPVIFTENITAGACANSYTITRQWTATDACGNNALHTQDITVEDTTNPTIIGLIAATAIEGCSVADAPSAASSVAQLEAMGISINDNCSADADMSVTFTDTPSGSCPITIARVYTVTDECGNSSIVNHSITIDDSTPPSISGTIPGTAVSGCGLADTPAAETDVAGLEALGIVVTDACSVDADINVSSSDASAGTCPVIVTRTYTLTDECGNFTTIDHIITIDDTTDPVLVAPADITTDCLSNVPPVYGSYAEWIGAGGSGSDNCGLNTSTFTFAGVSDDGNDCPKTLTRTYYIEDNCGNFTTVTQQVVINDVIPPTLTPPVQIDIECIADIPAAYISLPEFEFEGGTATDNCGIDASSFIHIGDSDDGLVNPKTITRTYRLADNCGNVSTVDQLIVIDDLSAPVISGCPADIGPLPMEAGVCGATATWVDPVASDNCDGAVAVVRTDGTGLNSGDLFPAGTTTIIYSATDTEGNITTCSFDITVDPDAEQPVISDCPADTGPLPMDAGACGAIVTFVDPTANDNCDGIVVPLRTDGSGLNSGDLFPAGTTTISYSATDAMGNVSTCSFDIIVNPDAEQPVISDCPADIGPLPMDAGLCGAIVTWTDPTAIDNCDGAIAPLRTDGSGLNSGDLFPEGTTTISYSATDAQGNVSTCSFDITVNPDAEQPVISDCPADIGPLPMDAGACGAIVNFVDPTANDNCDGAIVPVRTDGSGLNSGDLFPEGTTTISYSATDAMGNVSTCSFDITVNPDAEQPVISDCPADIGPLPMDAGACGAIVTWTDPTAIDNCDGIVGVVRTDGSGLNNGDLFPEGTTTISYSATDAMGNVSTCSFDITVNPDAEQPVISDCPADIGPLPMDAGACGAIVTWTDPTAIDNCDGAIAPLRTDGSGLNSGDLFPAGTTTISYSATDAQGNVSTCSFDVTVDPDAEAPVISDCPSDQDPVAIDAGVCGATITWTDPTATDNCDGVVIPVRTDGTGLNSGDVFPVGVTVISYSATDARGNVSTCSFTVNIQDTELPVLTCIADQAIGTDPGICGYTVVGAEFDAAATDNCSVATLINDYNGTTTLAGELLPSGTTTITWTATDASGNVGTCQFDVTVTDNEVPVLVTIDTTLNIGAGGTVVIDSSYVYDATASSDNCGIATVGIDINTFTCAELGANTVNITMSDAAGNTISGTATVTLIDTTTTVANAGNDEEMCITDGSFTITTASLVNGDVFWGTTGDGTFDDPTLVLPTYTLGATDSDSVKLYMDLTATIGCKTLSDTMKLTIYSAPTAFAGNDIDLCGTPPDVTLSDATASNGAVLWTSSGNGSFDDPTAINPVYTFGSSDTGPVILTITVTGPGTCGSAVDDIQINFVAAPTADAGADDAVCGSAIDYQVTDASSSGVSVLWTSSGDGTFDDDTADNPVYTFGTTDLSSGSVTLTLTVTGGSTCPDAIDDKIITINPIPAVTVLEHTDISCNGLTDGIVRIEGAVGASPYTYSIDGGAYVASGDFTGLAAATYLFSVQDQNGCARDTSITITEPASLTMALDSVDHNACYQSNDAAIYVSAAGGTSPYIVSWTGPNGFSSSSLNISGLEAGLYSLNFTDANNCAVFTLDTTIIEPAQIVISPVSESDYNGYGVSCNGGSDGFIEVAVSGGTGPLTISWTGPGGFVTSDEDIIDLAAGDYTLTVTDSTGCAETYDVSLVEPSALDLTFDVTDAQCPGDNTGEIDLTITGGVPPYAVLWNDGESTEDRIGISNGTHIVDVTDANGCTEQASITVDVLGINCIRVPEIITPGNVDGKNDFLIIQHIDIYPNAEIRIFSRWGKLVYNAKNLNTNRWDGTFKGKPLPVDSYHYILDLGDGSTPLTGTITIIR